MSRTTPILEVKTGCRKFFRESRSERRGRVDFRSFIPQSLV